jgi:iron(III) transport system permease protein
MRVPFYVTCVRVTAPVCLPAILEVGMYFFVNSMATVSAVIFLYSADIPLATVAVANMDDAGDIAAAAAMATLIVLVNVGVRLLYEAATRRLQRRTQAWTAA